MCLGAVVGAPYLHELISGSSFPGPEWSCPVQMCAHLASSRPGAEDPLSPERVSPCHVDRSAPLSPSRVRGRSLSLADCLGGRGAALQGLTWCGGSDHRVQSISEE